MTLGHCDVFPINTSTHGRHRLRFLWSFYPSMGLR